MIDLRRVKKIKTFGQSMEPLLQDGDILLYKKCPFEAIKINDIVLVQKDHLFFAHRVIYKSKKYIVTKGDNNASVDEKIYEKDIIGLVYEAKRGSISFNPESYYLLQSTIYFSEIIKVNTLLDEKHIKYLYLKGLPVHLYYEKNHPRRPFADCDLLVAKDDFGKTESLLKQIGYRLLDKSFASQKHTSFFLEKSFFKEVKGFPVILDVHIHPVFLMVQIDTIDTFYSKRLLEAMTQDFFKKRRNIQVNGNRFAILNHEDLILYLALHFFHHNYKGAYRLELLHKIILSNIPVRLDWAEIEKQIGEYDINHFVFPVFQQLKKYYQTPIPEAFLERIAPRNLIVHFIAKVVCTASIFNDESRLYGGLKRFLLLFIFSKKNILQKIKYIFSWRVSRALFEVLRGCTISLLNRALVSVNNTK